MFKTKILLSLFTCLFLLYGVYVYANTISLRIKSQTTELLSFKVEGGKAPYAVTVAGEGFKVRKYQNHNIIIKNPPLGKYIILVRDHGGSVKNFEILIEE